MSFMFIVIANDAVANGALLHLLTCESGVSASVQRVRDAFPTGTLSWQPQSSSFITSMAQRMECM